MKPLTIVYHTARDQPEIDWFFDSLEAQEGISLTNLPDVVVVDRLVRKRSLGLWGETHLRHVQPKPTVWQGKYRLTAQDWWAASNSRNTGICLCQTEWVALLDDRSVLLPGWLKSVEEAMAGNYAVFGAYEKRIGMTVENGVIKTEGKVIGSDSREAYVNTFRQGEAPTPAAGEWAFGCNLALPLDWALQVNAFDENCDGLGMEDVCFGLMLQNNGFDLRYDKRMKIIEDRTPGETGPVMKREDKGISPNDKSHALLNTLRGLKQATHPFNLRQVRDAVLAGEPFPPPWGPTHDFWDNQPLEAM